MTYTHRVVKRQRGADGKWFNHPGRGYATAEAAIEAAREFAASQCAAGVAGTEIDVRSRRGDKAIVTFRWHQANVTMVDWR